MAKLYAHRDGHYVGGLCAPRDFVTLSEANANYRRIRLRRGEYVCHYCGQQMIATEGMFYVLKWRGDGAYRAADAVASYHRRQSANAHAERLGSEYVVRAW